MTNGSYTLAGVSYSLQAPFSLEVTCESAEFYSPLPGLGERSIVLQPAQELFVSAGTVRGDRLYYSAEDGPVMATVDLSTGKPYAAAHYLENGNILCRYREDYRHKLATTAGLLNRLGLEKLLLYQDTLLLHGALVSWQGRGILFSGDSGVGKSTQAGLWEKYRSARILNGDRAGLRKRQGIWTAWGLPYAGTSGIYRNACAPVQALVVLRQAKENSLRLLRGAEAFAQLYPQLSLHRWEEKDVNRGVDLLADLLSRVPVYMLQCLPDTGAVELLANALNQGRDQP